MNQIIDRQSFVISVNVRTLTGVDHPSQVSLPMNSRFAADALVLRSIIYDGDEVDLNDVIQVWCNITYDELIAASTNDKQSTQVCNSFLKISNAFQTGNFLL